MPLNYAKLKFKRSDARSLYVQLVETLESAIEREELTAGTRLPSERALAEQLKLSRTTVVNAYRELEARGLLRSHVGRGTFVCARPERTDAPFAWRGKVSAFAQQSAGDPSLRNLHLDTMNSRLISFAAGIPAIECFPLADYRRLLEQVLKEQSDAVLGLGPTEGQLPLRRAIAARGRTRAERVLVLSGSQQGLDLIARCLIDAGDTVVLDRPGYVGAIQTFRAAGAKLVGWDTVRADLDELEDLFLRYRPKLLYTNPTFQNPTGRVFNLRERRDLLRLAVRYRIPVVEDDPYRETYLEAANAPPPSLYELDEHNIVIHHSTFSKVLAPGLRLGWLAASEYVVDQLALIKQRENLFTEGLSQLVVAELMQSGLYDEHLARLRREHARRRDRMSDALARHVPARLLTCARPKGGLYFWCRLSHKLKARQLLRQATEAGVVFANGEIFYSDEAGAHELRLCFASQSGDKIEEGIKRLAACLKSEHAADAPREESLMPMV
ncbi:MAG TPA: PLP-dependent aminotransferase family protein [Pyrinomonadaceae bacterium]|jgi:DNA-binding transcriptional MocR family regulator